MSDFYGEMADIASEVLAEFKQGAITLTKQGTETPGENPWDPPVVGAPVIYTLDAAAKPVSEKLIDGTTILATDIEITAAVFGYEPQPGDILTIDGRTVTIVRQMRIPAAGTLVAWRWIVRG